MEALDNQLAVLTQNARRSDTLFAENDDLKQALQLVPPLSPEMVIGQVVTATTPVRPGAVKALLANQKKPAGDFLIICLADDPYKTRLAVLHKGEIEVLGLVQSFEASANLEGTKASVSFPSLSGPVEDPNPGANPKAIWAPGAIARSRALLASLPYVKLT